MHRNEGPQCPGDQAVEVWEYARNELTAVVGAVLTLAKRLEAIAALAGDDEPGDAVRNVKNAVSGEGGTAGATAGQLIHRAIAAAGDPETRCRLIKFAAAFEELIVTRLRRLVTMFDECRHVVDPIDHADFVIVLREAADSTYAGGHRSGGMTVRQLIRDARDEAQRQFEDARAEAETILSLV